jgi:predicted transcriptional regulator
MKDSGLRIRVERQLREKFLELCREQDRPASQVIREFMRDYIERHQENEADREQQRTKP